MWETPTEHRVWFGRKAPEEWLMWGVQGCKYREAAVGRGYEVPSLPVQEKRRSF